MRSTSEKVPEEKNSMEEDLKALQKTVSDLCKSFEGWTQQKSKQRNDSGSFKSDTPEAHKRRCFICGSDRHLKNRCPQNSTSNKNNTSRFSYRKKNHQAKHVASASTGLFVECKINDVVTDCLVDTGATLSVLSVRTWDIINQSCTTNLEVFKQQIFTASGNPLEITGSATVMIELCGIKSVTKIIVADIDNDAILGLDFLKANDCQIDITSNTLKIKGRKCQLNLAGKLGCYRVTLSEKLELPSRTEMIIEGKVDLPPIRKHDLGIIEPTERSFQIGKGLVAKALVHSNDKVPLRIVNLSNETELLYPGTHIANLSFVSNVYDGEQKGQETKHSKRIPSHLSDLYDKTTVGLSPKQCGEIKKLLIKHQSTFSESDDDLGRTGIIRHKIPTGMAQPIKQPPRRLPVHMNEEADKQIEDMLKKEVIQPSSSPWASGIVMVQKKDGSKRFCVDYRKLNDVTLKDAYPLPRIDSSLDQLAGAQWFSCLDLNSGYWQVEVDKQDRQKTAFSSRSGLFEFKVMPIGLCNAPATFERLMETVLAGLNWKICLIYLDDIIVLGKTFEDMIDNLDKVLEKLHDAGLKLKPRKCQLFKPEVEFLGHIISCEGVKTDPKKTQVVSDWPKPEDIKSLRSFLGFCSYYRRFIPRFSEIAKPLHRLSEKGVKFTWSDECNSAFETLKKKMVEAPILAHPDFSKEFIIDTDASDVAIGAVLSQKFDEKEYVIAYASRTLTKSERRYCVTKKELLALVHFVKYFRHYLYGKPFTVRTDHGSLRWLMNFKNPEGQIARWIEILAAYDMKIEHRPGRLHRNADRLSRIPCRQCVHNEERKHREKGNLNIACPVQMQDEDSIEIKCIQEKDPDISLVKSWIKEGSKPEHKDIASGSYFLKSLWSQWSRLEIKDNLLVRKWEVLGTETINWQAVVPMTHRRLVLKYAHDIKASGHLGITKTLGKIRQRYYWPGLQNDVRDYVNGCEKCNKIKDPTKSKVAPMQLVRSGFPMERLAIDILGELPKTENGNKYILVVADYFTKWTECFGMPNMETVTIARILVNDVISKFGIPAKIHSFQGSQFESNLFTELCKLLQVEKTRTTPYHPQSDGMVERFNRTLATMLRAFVNENQRDWDEQLPYVMMAYRSTEHETTGLTPYMLMLGRETATPLDIMFEMPQSLKSIPVNQWVWEIRERLESAHTLVREYTGESMKRQKKYHDRRVSYERFEAGDSVYVYFPVRKSGHSSKLTCFWRGPFQVSERLSDVLYKVNCGRLGSIQVIHCDRMRKAKSQLLLGEDIDQCTNEHESETYPDTDNVFEENASAPDEVSDGKRVRRKPTWTKDYFMYTCRSMMPQTKTTPRKHALCPVCKELIVKEDFAKHVVDCSVNRVECEKCGVTFKKQIYLIKHQKRQHAFDPFAQNKSDSEPKQVKQLETASTLESNSEPEDWDKDPDIELEEGIISEKRYHNRKGY